MGHGSRTGEHPRGSASKKDAAEQAPSGGGGRNPCEHVVATWLGVGRGCGLYIRALLVVCLVNPEPLGPVA